MVFGLSQYLLIKSHLLGDRWRYSKIRDYIYYHITTHWLKIVHFALQTKGSVQHYNVMLHS